MRMDICRARAQTLPMRLQSLTAHRRSGDQLTDEEVRSLWQYRLRIFRLKPDIEPEQDWLWFRDLTRKSNDIWRFQDVGGQLVGFYQSRTLTRTIQGRAVSVVIADFAFIDRRFRGHPVTQLALARTLAPILAASLRRPTYALAVPYPTTLTSATRRGGRPIYDGEAVPGSLDAAVMDSFRLELTGDETPGSIVSMNTIPETPSEIWQRRHVGDAALKEYEQRNPRWREGYCLFIGGRLDVAFHMQVALSVAQRWMRKRQPVT